MGSSYNKAGYARSGGGGGSKVTLYSHPASLNLTGAAAPRSANIRGAQYDYLRPNVSVAGSRYAQARNII